MDSLRFEFEPDEFGWAFARFSSGSWSYETQVSYLSDPLRGLVRATLSMFSDQDNYEPDYIAFDAEGGGLSLAVCNADCPPSLKLSKYRGREDGEELYAAEKFADVDAFKAQSQKDADLLLRFSNLTTGIFGLFGPSARLPFALLIESEVFAKEVLRSVESVYDNFGIQDYFDRFWNDLPVAEMLRLRSALGLPSRDRPLW